MGSVFKDVLDANIRLPCCSRRTQKRGIEVDGVLSGVLETGKREGSTTESCQVNRTTTRVQVSRALTS